MPDDFSSQSRTKDHPGEGLVAVTPSDGTDLAAVSRGLYVGVAGDVSVILANDSAAVTLTGLASGIVHPLRAKRVRSTGTTATGIVAVY